MTDIHLACQCGNVAGTVCGVTPASCNHLICYCEDCQAFARHLGQDASVLDPQGGSDIVQVSAGRVHFDQGAEQLAVLRLSPKGLFRWYAACCCNTPIANTLSTPAMPFAGLIHACLRQDELNDAAGSVRGAVHTEFARGDVVLPKASMPAAIWRFAKMMLRARWRGEHKRSPFFAADGKPVARPYVLSEAERQAAYGGA